MNNDKKNEEKKPTCGIIMPIGAIDSCPADHWNDVLEIIKDVCIVSGFEANLVNDADDIGIIHKRIVENIYSNDIVLCDVSCKNANVMFELGMRLAFDKPTIIIKDEITGYSFDTSLIEHIEYPRDLRFNTIIKFKENLEKKMKATFEKAKDPSYSTFLKNFGKYKIAHLEEKEVTPDTFILNAIEDLKRDVRMIRNMSINEDNTRERQMRRTIFNREISEEDKSIFKKYVQYYLKQNNLKRPKDIQISFDEMAEELEKIEELRGIAGNGQQFRRLINEAIGM
jgi:hypothetical protein